MQIPLCPQDGVPVLQAAVCHEATRKVPSGIRSKCILMPPEKDEDRPNGTIMKLFYFI